MWIKVEVARQKQLRTIFFDLQILENKRLDLDSCKNKVRKARAMQLQPVVSKVSIVCDVNIVHL
jgi:hypothetical protein